MGTADRKAFSSLLPALTAQRGTPKGLCTFLPLVGEGRWAWIRADRGIREKQPLASGRD